MSGPSSANRSARPLMRRHRTTARGVLFLAVTIGLVAGSAAASAAGKVPDHIVFPVVGKVAVHRRLRRAPRRQPASGERPHGREEVAGGGRRGRQGEVLDDFALGRLHALPLRRERDDVPLHPPEQRRDDEERQPRQVRARNGVRREERRQGRGGATDRLRRRLRRRERRRVRTCTSKSIPAAARP